MKPSEVVKEFLYLNKVDIDTPTSGLQDSLLNGKILARETGDNLLLYYLDSSSTIKIPVGYLRIFRALDVTEGERLLYSKLENLDRLDLFIVGLSRFIRYLDTFTCEEEAIEILQTLCTLGTKEFRNFLEDELEMSLKPWIFENIEKNLEL